MKMDGDMPVLEPADLKLINESTMLTSLLYDLNLLPEVIATRAEHPDVWAPDVIRRSYHRLWGVLIGFSAAEMLFYDGYRVVTQLCPDDGGVIATVPTLPGCSAHGETDSEARREIVPAIIAWIAAAKNAGNPVPEAP